MTRQGGAALLLAGLFILFFAVKIFLFSSELVATPRPGGFLFKILILFNNCVLAGSPFPIIPISACMSL